MTLVDNVYKCVLYTIYYSRNLDFPLLFKTYYNTYTDTIGVIHIGNIVTEYLTDILPYNTS